MDVPLWGLPQKTVWIGLLLGCGCRSTLDLGSSLRLGMVAEYGRAERQGAVTQGTSAFVVFQGSWHPHHAYQRDVLSGDYAPIWGEAPECVTQALCHYFWLQEARTLEAWDDEIP